MTYRDYLNKKHPSYLKIGLKNIELGDLSNNQFGAPIALGNLPRKGTPIVSYNLFKPFTSSYDILHECYGMTYYPLMYLFNGVVESSIDFIISIARLFEDGLPDASGVPIAVAIVPIPVMILCGIGCVLIDIAINTILAVSMFVKSMTALIFGSIATGISAVFGPKCLDNLAPPALI
jgi:hypothetical protein